MSETNTSQTRPARRGRGPMQSGMPGEKATDFKGTLKKLLKYASVYRAALIIVIAQCLIAWIVAFVVHMGGSLMGF